MRVHTNIPLRTGEGTNASNCHYAFVDPSNFADVLVADLLHSSLKGRRAVRPSKYFVGQLEAMFLHPFLPIVDKILDGSYVPGSLEIFCQKEALEWTCAHAVMAQAGHKVISDALAKTILSTHPVMSNAVVQVPTTDPKTGAATTKEEFNLLIALSQDAANAAMIKAAASKGADLLNLEASLPTILAKISRLNNFMGLATGPALDPSEYPTVLRKVMSMERAVEVLLDPTTRNSRQNNAYQGKLYSDGYILGVILSLYLDAAKSEEDYIALTGPGYPVQHSQARWTVIGLGAQKLAWLYTSLSLSYHVASMTFAAGLQKTSVDVLKGLSGSSMITKDAEETLQAVFDLLDSLEVPFISAHVASITSNLTSMLGGKTLLPSYISTRLGISDFVTLAPTPIKVSSSFDGRLFSAFKQRFTDLSTIDSASLFVFGLTKDLRILAEKYVFALSLYIPSGTTLDTNPFAIPSDLLTKFGFKFQNIEGISYRSLSTPDLLPTSIDRFDTDSGDWILKKYQYQTICLSAYKRELAANPAPRFYWSGRYTLPSTTVASDSFAEAPIPFNYYAGIYRDRVPNSGLTLKQMFSEVNVGTFGSSFFDYLLRLVLNDSFVRNSLVNTVASYAFIYSIKAKKSAGDDDKITWYAPTLPFIYGAPTTIMEAVQMYSSSIGDKHDNFMTAGFVRTALSQPSTDKEIRFKDLAITLRNGDDIVFLVPFTRVPDPHATMDVPYKWDNLTWISTPMSTVMTSHLAKAETGDLTKYRDRVVYYNESSMLADTMLESFNAFYSAMSVGLMSDLGFSIANKSHLGSAAKTITVTSDLVASAKYIFSPVKGWSPKLLRYPHLFARSSSSTILPIERTSIAKAITVGLSMQEVPGRRLLWSSIQEEQYWLPEYTEEDEAIDTPFDISTSDYSVNLELGELLGIETGSVGSGVPVNAAGTPVLAAVRQPQVANTATTSPSEPANPTTANPPSQSHSAEGTGDPVPPVGEKPTSTENEPGGTGDDDPEGKEKLD